MRSFLNVVVVLVVVLAFVVTASAAQAHQQLPQQPQPIPTVVVCKNGQCYRVYAPHHKVTVRQGGLRALIFGNRVRVR